MRLILSLSGLINKWKVIVHQTIPVEFAHEKGSELFFSLSRPAPRPNGEVQIE